MHIQNNTFLTPEQKLEYYSKISGVKLGQYPTTFTLKVYQGAEILIYHYDEDNSLVLDSIMKMIAFVATEKGIRLTFIDLETHQVISVGEIPNRFGRFDIITHVPYSCYVERTVKKTSNNKYLQGMASAMCMRTKSNSKRFEVNHHYAMAKSYASKVFDQEELELAVAKWEAGIND